MPSSIIADASKRLLLCSGDIAMRILDHAKDKHFDRKTHVQMLDINPEMLEEGKRQFARTMYHDGELDIAFATGH